MYRAPEMVDLYSNYPITSKSDIWVSLVLLFVSSTTYFYIVVGYIIFKTAPSYWRVHLYRTLGSYFLIILTPRVAFQWRALVLWVLLIFLCISFLFRMSKKCIFTLHAFTVFKRRFNISLLILYFLLEQKLI